jgi:hypothetical protein
MGVVGRVDPVQHPLDIAPDHRQRGPQLVGDVGQQGAALGLVGLETLGHLVEGVGQAGDLSRPPHLDPGRVVPAGDPVGRLHHVPDRGRHPPHRPAGHERHAQQRQDQQRERRAVPTASAATTRPELAAPEQPPGDPAGQKGEPKGQRHQQPDPPRKPPPGAAPPRPPSPRAAPPRRRERLPLRPPRRPPPRPWPTGCGPPRPLSTWRGPARPGGPVLRGAPAAPAGVVDSAALSIWGWATLPHRGTRHRRVGFRRARGRGIRPAPGRAVVRHRRTGSRRRGR